MTNAEMTKTRLQKAIVGQRSSRSIVLEAPPSSQLRLYGSPAIGNMIAIPDITDLVSTSAIWNILSTQC